MNLKISICPTPTLLQAWQQLKESYVIRASVICCGRDFLQTKLKKNN